MSENHKPRRWRIYLVKEELILNLLRIGKRLPEKFDLPFLNDLPDTAKVLRAETDFDRAAIKLLVEDPSFNDIPYGMDLPIHPCNVEWRSIDVEGSSAKISLDVPLKDPPEDHDLFFVRHFSP